MIADVCAQLVGWLSDAVRPVAVDAEPPATSDQDRVSCFLSTVSPVDSVSGGVATPLRFALAFVISVDAATSRRAAEILDMIVLAAAQRPDLELLPSSPDLTFWRAFEVPPRPALVVHANARVERSQSQARPVLAPLAVHGVGIHRLNGRVVSRQGVPVAAAEVRLRGAPRSAWTDTRGRFTIPSAPGETERSFSIDARGRTFAVAISDTEDADLELIIDPLGAQS